VLEEAEATARGLRGFRVDAMDVAAGTLAGVTTSRLRRRQAMAVTVREEAGVIIVSAEPAGDLADGYLAALDLAIRCRLERREPGT
jgi:hypothetical protein